MKKYLLILLMILFVFSCEDKGDQFDSQVSGMVYEPQEIKKTTKRIEDDYLKTIDQFAFDLLNGLYNSDENINLSPVSAHMILALVSHGGANDTKEEIQEVLHINHYTDDQIAENNKILYENLYKNGEVGKLLIANSIWKREGLAFKDSFIERGKTYYSELYDVDFSKDKTAENMNEWAKYHTHDLIDPKLQTDASRVMVLMNALYFYDEWEVPFEESSTNEESFFTKNKTETVQMMHQSFDSKSYYEGDFFYKTALNVSEVGSVYFVLPKDNVSIENILSNPILYSEALYADMNNHASMNIKLPKVDFSNNFPLKELLMDLGMKEAFGSNADFSNMIDMDVLISNVQQLTHLTFDEKKVEAAAVTIVEVAESMALEDKKVINFYLNKPFMYFIKDTNGICVFIGIINNPNWQ